MQPHRASDLIPADVELVDARDQIAEGDVPTEVGEDRPEPASGVEPENHQK
jgi:hypothetical protein